MNEMPATSDVGI